MQAERVYMCARHAGTATRTASHFSSARGAERSGRVAPCEQTNMQPLAETRPPDYYEKLEEFLKAYRRERCLWQHNNVDFFNKIEKYAAIDRLLVIYRKVVPTAVPEDITKKINSFRNMYRQEKQKIEAAKKYNPAHVPKLWCYHLLTFVDEEAPLEPAQHQPSGEEQGDMETVAFTKKADDIEVKTERDTLSTDHSEEPFEIPRAKRPRTDIIAHHSSDTLHADGNSNSAAVNEVLLRVDKTKEPLELGTLATDHAHAEVPIGVPRPIKPETFDIASVSDDQATPRDERRTEDRHDIYCKSIACILRELPTQQRLLAEKLINDVLFEAEWGSLTLSHKITE